MKTERRQELRANDLSAFLMDTYDWAKDHATQIGGAVVLIAIIIFTTSYVRRSRADSMDTAIEQMTQLSFSGDEVEQSFATLDSLIAETADRNFKMTALLQKGQRALNLAVDGTGKVDAKLLDQAESAYKQLQSQYPDRMPIVATALQGLATVEENRFVIDGDIRHRENAKGYLETVVNGAAFRGTPFQTRAAERVKNLDRTFRTVTIAAAVVAPVAPASDALPDTQRIQLGTAEGQTIELNPTSPPQGENVPIEEQGETQPDDESGR